MFATIARGRLAAVGVLAAAGIAAAVISSSGASAQAPVAAPRTIAFTEIEKANPCCIADIAPKNRSKREPFMSPGDALVFSQVLRAAGGKNIGRLYAKCAAIVPGPLTRARYLCEGSYAFADGTLTSSGLSSFSNPTSTGAITGGTGAYANAHGTFTSKQPKGGGNTETIVTLAG